MLYSRDKIVELEKRYGSPLYVFDEKAFVENYLEFVNCFTSKYSKYCLAYSYKTNYAPYICKIIKENGGYAEVVSDMEYRVAKEIGYDDSHIIYNGPFKGPLSIKMLMNGGKLHIDNFEELNDVLQVAKHNPFKLIKIGIRANIDIGQPFVSRFGVDYESGDLEKAFEMVKHFENVEIIGLHCHIGQSRTIEAWKNRVKKMLEIADRFFDNTPEYFDLGSGMFAKMNPYLATQFGGEKPSFDNYAEVVCNEFAVHYGQIAEHKRPLLFTEPGTTVINKYVDFIGKITSIKQIKGKTFAVMNCSKHNLGEICTLKRLPYTVIHNSNETKDYLSVDFVGYTCLEHDVMLSAESVNLGVGDYIVFENVGGYSNVDKPPFILPNCMMIAIDENMNCKVIKRKEEFEDVFSTYVF